MDIVKSLGERIIELRKKNNINREDLAKELEIPYTTLRNYENGLREPGHLFLIKVAKRFNVSTDYLLGIDTQKNAFATTKHEEKVIIAYRDKPEMQPAVDKLLGVEEIHTTPAIRAARSFGDKSKIDRNADIDEQRFIDAPESDIDM